MSSNIGYSIYVSTWRENIEALSSVYTEGASVFTSLHVPEENKNDFISESIEMIKTIKKIGYKVIVDVSTRTLLNFNVRNLDELINMLELDIVRIDYGFTDEEINRIKSECLIAINASTISETSLVKLINSHKNIIAVHNFYPRADTGLDDEQFRGINKMLCDNGLKVYAFIPGDINLRGPIFEGLPTIESHRRNSPYACYVDMDKNYSVDGIIVGDGILSNFENKLISNYRESGIISVPIVLDQNYKYLNGAVFSIREDSPYSLMRLKESREYSSFGEIIMDYNCIERKIGSLTIDNYKYARYSGEIQITKRDYGKDERVNVIGNVKDEYRLLLRSIRNGDKIKIIDI
jgi:hypothetical protein